ncbi:TetR/AcrR family transcriptional regulator [Saccharothrix coeruleofusca]|uniref:TetR family transcriptional regulator n=1 Tax=Saccharothrix coeruleofusca TaxID=33919 RepID=A0A918AVV3_9PSEU|nr:TetR/AcrR family transcriptional regulator [Saccharothrix coeruleofusca]MBP2335452.1 AcrR family transcriptional regulator [Saccharothrix coeruleofusca]GGP77860.1 TetR family transcriptional regulator [Saccharothrix coeruleofusca]
MTGGYLKGRIRREDILAAAVTVYGEVGYHGSSLREIAKRAGITHAGLLYHFPNKESLLAAVLERRDALDAAREQLQARPGLEVLRRYLALAEHNVGNPGIVDLYSRLAAEAVAEDHPAHEYFVRHYRMARAGVLESFRAMADSGELREGVDPEVAALTFIALMDGLQVQWLTTPDEVDLVGSLEFYLRSLLTVGL